MEKKVENLYQLHWQSIAPPYTVMEFKSQKEVNSPEEMSAWCEDVGKRHPLPEGMCWVRLNWDHKNFVKTDLPTPKPE